MKRREFLQLSLVTAASAALSTWRAGAGGHEGNSYRLPEEWRAGHYAAARSLGKSFPPQGISVKWVEFSSGPPMMEAMNVGSVDYGAVGDILFADSSRRPRVRRSPKPRPSPSSMAQASWCCTIRQPRPSPISRANASALPRKDPAHNVVIQTLKKPGSTATTSSRQFISTPPDGRPCFRQSMAGSMLKAIWDPYFA